MRRDRREAVLLGIACTVVVVWAVATLVQVIDPSRQVPTGVNVVMPIVATALFGSAYFTNKRNGGDK